MNLLFRPPAADTAPQVTPRTTKRQVRERLRLQEARRRLAILKIVDLFDLELGSPHSQYVISRGWSTSHLYVELAEERFRTLPAGVSQRHEKRVIHYPSEQDREVGSRTFTTSRSVWDGIDRLLHRLGRVTLDGKRSVIGAHATPWTAPGVKARWVAVEWDGIGQDELDLMLAIDDELQSKIERAGLRIEWMRSGRRSWHAHVYLVEAILHEEAVKLAALMHKLIPGAKADATNVSVPTRLPLSRHVDTGGLACYAGTNDEVSCIEHIFKIERAGTRAQVRQLLGEVQPLAEDLPGPRLQLQSQQGSPAITDIVSYPSYHLCYSIPKGTFTETFFSEGYQKQLLRSAGGSKRLAVQMAAGIAVRGVDPATAKDRLQRIASGWLAKTAGDEGTWIPSAKVVSEDLAWVIDRLPDYWVAQGMVSRRLARSLAQTLQFFLVLANDHNEIVMDVRRLARDRSISFVTAQNHIQHLMKLDLVELVALVDSETAPEDRVKRACKNRKDKTWSFQFGLARRFHINYQRINQLAMTLGVPEVVAKTEARCN